MSGYGKPKKKPRIYVYLQNCMISCPVGARICIFYTISFPLILCGCVCVRACVYWQDWHLGGKCDVYLWGAGRHGQLAEAGRNILVPITAPSFSQAQQVITAPCSASCWPHPPPHCAHVIPSVLMRLCE